MDMSRYIMFYKTIIEMIIMENNKRRSARLLQIICRRQQMKKNIYLQIKRYQNMIMNVLEHQMSLSPMNLTEFCFEDISTRRIWMKHRSYHFWNHIVLNTYDEAQWLESFRIKRTILFVMSCD